MTNKVKMIRNTDTGGEFICTDELAKRALRDASKGERGKWEIFYKEIEDRPMKPTANARAAADRVAAREEAMAAPVDETPAEAAERAVREAEAAAARAEKLKQLAKEAEESEAAEAEAKAQAEAEAAAVEEAAAKAAAESESDPGSEEDDPGASETEGEGGELPKDGLESIRAEAIAKIKAADAITGETADQTDAAKRNAYGNIGLEYFGFKVKPTWKTSYMRRKVMEVATGKVKVEPLKDDEDD